MNDWPPANTVPTSAAELDAIFTGVVSPLLVARGFTQVTGRRWVRAFEPVRHVFEIAATKGMSHYPRWGLSLDFVPHLKGAALAWHRTDKSAMLDLHDFLDDDRRMIRSLWGPEATRSDSADCLPDAVERACAWLDDVRDVRVALERAETLRASQTSFEGWVQAPLAYAFLLARNGSVAQSQVVLDRWIEDKGVQPMRDKLQALLVA